MADLSIFLFFCAGLERFLSSYLSLQNRSYCILIITINQHYLLPTLGKAIDIVMIVFFQRFWRKVHIIQSCFYVGSMMLYLIEMNIYETVRHRKANKPNGRQIMFIKILSPIKGNITAFHDKVLPILNRSLYHLPNNRPKITSQCLVIRWRKVGHSAANQSHFQVVDADIRHAIIFQHPLCQKGLACV